MKLLPASAFLFLASYAIALLAISYNLVVTPMTRLNFMVICEKLEFSSVDDCLALWEVLK